MNQQVDNSKSNRGLDSAVVKQTCLIMVLISISIHVFHLVAGHYKLSNCAFNIHLFLHFAAIQSKHSASFR